MPALRNFYPGDIINCHNHFYLLIELDQENSSFDYDSYSGSLYQRWIAYSFCNVSWCSRVHECIADFRFNIADDVIFCGNDFA